MDRFSCTIRSLPPTSLRRETAAAHPDVQVRLARPASGRWGTALIAGRDFTWDDVLRQADGGDGVARAWRANSGAPPAAALGKQIRESNSRTWREVVGVVSDERDDGVDQKAPAAAIWPMLMTKFEGDDLSVRRTMSYVDSQPAGRHHRVHQRSRPRRVVHQSEPAAGEREDDSMRSSASRWRGHRSRSSCWRSRGRWRCCWASPASTA